MEDFDNPEVGQLLTAEAPTAPKPEPFENSEVNALVDPEWQHRQLERKRQEYAGQDQSLHKRLVLSSVPFVSAIGQTLSNQHYGAAKEKFAQGTANDQDIEIMAEWERRHQEEENRSLGGKVGSALLGVPAIAGEAMATPFSLPVRGAGGFILNKAIQAQLMPSMTLQHASARAAEQGGSTFDPQNLAPAAAFSAVQNMVLGSLGHVASGVANPAARFLAKTAAGVGEMQGANVLAGAVDEILPEAYQTKTRYGAIGSFLRGEAGEGFKQLAVDTVTMAAFTALHGNPGLAKEMVQETADSLDAKARAGEPRETAAAAVREEARRAQLKIGDTEVLTPQSKDLNPAERYAVDKYGENKVLRVGLNGPDGPMGSATLAEEGDTIHVAWVGKTGLAGGEGRGKNLFGAREVFSLATQLAEAMPDAKFLKYTVSEGRIGEGKAKIVDLDAIRRRGKPNPDKNPATVSGSEEPQATTLKTGTSEPRPEPVNASQSAPEAPGASNAKDTTGLVGLGRGLAEGMTHGLYKGLFEALQKGSSRMAGIKDPALPKLKPFFDQGLLKTPEDVRKLVNAGYDPQKAGLTPSMSADEARAWITLRGLAVPESDAAAIAKATKLVAEAKAKGAVGVKRPTGEDPPEGPSIAEDVARQQAKQLIDSVDQGGQPAFVSQKLKATAAGVGVEVKGSDTPRDVVEKIRAAVRTSTPENAEKSSVPEQKPPENAAQQPEAVDPLAEAYFRKGITKRDQQIHGRVITGEPMEDIAKDLGMKNRQAVHAALKRVDEKLPEQFRSAEIQKQLKLREVEGQPAQPEGATVATLRANAEKIAREQQTKLAEAADAELQRAAEFHGSEFKEELRAQLGPKVQPIERTQYASGRTSEYAKENLLRRSWGATTLFDYVVSRGGLNVDSLKKNGIDYEAMANESGIPRTLFAHKKGLKIDELADEFFGEGKAIESGFPFGRLDDASQGVDRIVKLIRDHAMIEPGGWHEHQAEVADKLQQLEERRVRQEAIRAGETPADIEEALRVGREAGAAEPAAEESGTIEDAGADPGDFNPAELESSARATERPDVIPAETERVNVAAEIKKLRAQAATENQLQKSFTLSQIKDLQTAQKQGQEFYERPLPPPDGYRAGQQNGKDVWFKKREKQTFDAPARVAALMKQGFSRKAAEERATLEAAKQQHPQQAMGAAALGELTGSAEQRTNPRLTALAHAQGDIERENLDVGPAPARGGYSFERVNAAAEAAIRADPQLPGKILTELERKLRPLDAVETVVVEHEKVRLNNHLDRLNSVLEMGDAIDQAEYRREQLETLGQIERLMDLTDRAGSEAGGAFVLRQQLMAEDYSAVGLTRRAAAAKGSPLTTEERAQFEKMAQEISRLQTKLAAFERPDSPNAADARVELNRAKRTAKQTIGDLKLANLPIPQRVFRGGMEMLDASRALMTSMDFSAVLRQGGALAFGHPVVMARALPEMFRATLSEHQAALARDAIEQRPNSLLYKRAGLYLADPHAPLSAQEESFAGRWVKKIPGIAASERAYTTVLNRVRADVFDAMISSEAAKGQVSDKAASALANFVNIASGRGNLGGLERAGTTLARIFFSPRFVASRFQLVAGSPLWGGTMSTRQAIIKEYARTAIGLGVFYGAAAMAAQAFGAKKDEFALSFDPRSADFGKIKMGNTRIDPLFGLAQTIVLEGRTATGQTKSTKTSEVTSLSNPKFGQSSFTDVLSRFIRSKLAPIPGALIDLREGKNVVGQPATLGSKAQELVTPIAVEDVVKAIKEQGVPTGLATGLAAIFGMGVQVYEKKQAAVPVGRR